MNTHNQWPLDKSLGRLPDAQSGHVIEFTQFGLQLLIYNISVRMRPSSGRHGIWPGLPRVACPARHAADPLR